MRKVPEDLGRRIVDATRLAVAMHLQSSLLSASPCFDLYLGGAEFSLDGVEPAAGGTGRYGGAAMDGGASSAPLLAESHQKDFSASTPAESEAR
jgi:hypothetical protein